MSRTGKSSIVRELAARGFKAVDTDDGWCEPLWTAINCGEQTPSRHCWPAKTPTSCSPRAATRTRRSSMRSSTTVHKTRGAETAEVARAFHAQKVCEAEHGGAHEVFDREVN
jgi:hypothetical protein